MRIKSFQRVNTLRHIIPTLARETRPITSSAWSSLRRVVLVEDGLQASGGGEGGSSTLVLVPAAGAGKAA